jgi:hypothetical protein
VSRIRRRNSNKKRGRIFKDSFPEIDALVQRHKHKKNEAHK